MERHLLITLEESVTRGTQGLTVRTTEGAGNVLVQVPDNTTVVSLDELIQAVDEIKAFNNGTFTRTDTDGSPTTQQLVEAMVERELEVSEVPDLEFDESGNVVVK